MSRRRIIIVLTCSFYALQVGLLVCWHMLASVELRMVDALISVGIAAVLGIVDASAARYLLQALHRSETVYAADVSTRLERSLEGYRLVAEHDERLVQEVGRAVEKELLRARKALAQRRAAAVDEHLRTSVGIASLTRPPYCDNVAVSAVLDSKARQCEEAGVGFDAKVDVPADLALPDVEVAAVFFNLIDNALHECEALNERGGDATSISAEPNRAADTSPEGAPAVSVRAKVQTGQLFVEVSNPCRTEGPTWRHAGRNVWQKAMRRRSDTSREHGWGTEIVSTIAREHSGIAEFETHDRTFVATVMIPLPLEVVSPDEDSEDTRQA